MRVDQALAHVFVGIDAPDLVAAEPAAYVGGLDPAPGAAAFQELAKYYEHRERNYAMALEMTRSALHLEDSMALRRRAARLEKRAATPKPPRLL